jgi:hypothetical protein
MPNSVKVTVKTEFSSYPEVIAEYEGIKLNRFWNNPFLIQVVENAIKRAGNSNDAYDFTNLIYSDVNNALRKRYGGQELQLKSVSTLSISRNNKVEVVASK